MMTKGTQATISSTHVDIPIGGEMKRAQLGEGKCREMTNAKGIEHYFFVIPNLAVRQLDRHQMGPWIESDVSQVGRSAKKVNWY